MGLHLLLAPFACLRLEVDNPLGAVAVVRTPHIITRAEGVRLHGVQVKLLGERAGVLTWRDTVGEEGGEEC